VALDQNKGTQQWRATIYKAFNASERQAMDAMDAMDAMVTLRLEFENQLAQRQRLSGQPPTTDFVSPGCKTRDVKSESALNVLIIYTI
jgi:hypothetical protein